MVLTQLLTNICRTIVKSSCNCTIVYSMVVLRFRWRTVIVRRFVLESRFRTGTFQNAPWKWEVLVLVRGAFREVFVLNLTRS